MERREILSAPDQPASAPPAAASEASAFFDRRRALLVLGGAMLPTVASAQIAPLFPPLPGITVPRPVTPPVAAPPTIMSNSLGPIDRQKAYFLFFQQTIDVNTMKLLRSDLVALVEGGVTDITLIVSSNGGQVLPVLQMYSLIQALPVKIKTHAQVFVQSAANILFLAGQDRSADTNATFLFHPTQASISGVFNGAQFEDEFRLLNDAKAIMNQIYRDRTKLPDTEINRFEHETVVYDAQAALEHGIIQKVGGFQIPAERMKLVFVE
jgi:ATP-dependent protease ClpP protease subunit